MKSRYHRDITHDALSGEFSSIVLETIICANLYQDRLMGQIGHPYFHFDDNSFQVAYHYIDIQRAIISTTISQSMDPTPAWEALGRLTHAVQDFYAHSNYVLLWVESQSTGQQLNPEDIDPCSQLILTSPKLRSGRIYQPLELLTLLPGLERWIKLLLPRDSHAWMNLDTPKSSPLFAYAIVAARKRTRIEVEQVIASVQVQMDSHAVARFRGMDATL
ncbi:MAG: hypothetical protein PHQ40_17380 [Anaerolineaceae bacterium]|nr:hypothetical protein [Anaerolineaceae bacterium]